MEFLNLTNHSDLENAPILVLANKCDLPNAKTDSEITATFDLHDIKNHEW